MTDEERTAVNHEMDSPPADAPGADAGAWSPETPPAETEPSPVTFGEAAESAAPGDAAQARIAELERRVADLDRQVTTERDAASDYMQRWQRAQADFSNYKRRTQQEQEQREFIIAGRALATIFPALDSFERAFLSLPSSLRGYSWIDGIALVELQLRRALDTVGIQLIAAEPGVAFDPMRHESIGEIESAEHAAGSVGAVLQHGYEVRGLILRPALVQIAKAPQAAPEATSETAAETATAAAMAETAAETATADADAATATAAETATVEADSTAGMEEEER